MIRLPQPICELLISIYDDASLNFHRFDRDDAQFGAFILDEDHPLRVKVEKELRKFGLSKFGEMRVHKFSPDDYVLEHKDDAFPKQHTLVIRLDGNTGDSRFLVGGNFTKELTGVGVLIEPLQPHEVVTGCLDRYTLCTWVTLNEEGNE